MLLGAHDPGRGDHVFAYCAKIVSVGRLIWISWNEDERQGRAAAR